MPQKSGIGGRTARYDTLDGIRGIAAISVMIFHFNRSGSFRILYNEPVGVDLFFMLSGFVIAHMYGARLYYGMSVREYLSRRMIRLYPTYIVGILVGVPILFFLANSGLSNFSDRTITASFLANSLFLPYINGLEVRNLDEVVGTIGDIFPTNPPAWSLFFEMVSSIGFIYLIKLKRHHLVLTLILFYAAYVISGVIFARGYGCPHICSDLNEGWGVRNWLGGFPRVFFGFSFGILLYSLVNDERTLKIRNAIESRITSPYWLYALMLLVLSFPSEFQGLYPVICVAFIIPALVFMGAVVQCKTASSAKIASFLGWISFPMYCLHFPISRAVFLVTESLHLSKAIAVTASVVLTFAASVVVAKGFDEPARAFLSRKLTRRVSAPVAPTVSA